MQLQSHAANEGKFLQSKRFGTLDGRSSAERLSSSCGMRPLLNTGRQANASLPEFVAPTEIPLNQPVTAALLPVRRQTSRATVDVRRSSVECSISFNVSFTLLPETKSRKGDCDNWMVSACFSVASKTASPVLLSKSATTMVSLLVSLGWLWERQ